MKDIEYVSAGTSAFFHASICLAISTGTFSMTKNIKRTLVISDY